MSETSWAHRSVWLGMDMSYLGAMSEVPRPGHVVIAYPSQIDAGRDVIFFPGEV